MKKIACLAVFFGLCVSVVSVGAGEMRTWTAGGGKFTTEAEFVEVSKDGLFVTLRKKIDGKEIQVAMDRLSEEDREYIANPKKTSPANPAEQKPVDDSTFKVTEEGENKKDTLRVPVGIWAKKQYDILFKLSEERINEPQSVIDDYKRRAENNELEAQLRLGCYYFGNKQNEEAIKALEQAANRTKNTKTEQMAIASILGVFCFAIEDYKGALKWTRKSADLGSEDAKEFLLEVQMASAGRKGYKDGDALRAAQAKQPKPAPTATAKPIPNVPAKPINAANETQLELLKKSRDAARGRRDKAEDWIREYETYQKKKAEGRGLHEIHPFYRTPNIDRTFDQMRTQKAQAERDLESIGDKIRDLQNEQERVVRQQDAAKPIPNVPAKPVNAAKETQLEQLKKSRDAARGLRNKAEDWIREYETYQKKKAEGRGLHEIHPFYRTPNIDRTFDQMRTQKAQAERELESISDKIRDLQNEMR